MSWIHTHINDPYVKQAQREGWRSRAVYKLKEIDQKYQLFEHAKSIVDLGAAPGAWSQYAVSRLGKKAQVVALDILPIDPLPGVTLLQGDIREEDTLARLADTLSGQTVDGIISDMAPNLSGIREADQARAVYLAEMALAFGLQHLSTQGYLLVKMFQGAGFDAFLRQLRTHFTKVHIVKPKASRPKSRELYLLARGFAG